MSNPSAVSSFWSELIEINRRADALIDRCMKAIEPTQPISREIPVITSIEAEWNLLPTVFQVMTGGSQGVDAVVAPPSPNSDILSGSNIKNVSFQNGSSRMYIRELSFQPYTKTVETFNGDDRVATTIFARVPNPPTVFVNTLFPFNWRWNFHTSITDKWYSKNGRVLAASGGRARAGNHIAFREPLVLEPMETLLFECELIGFGMDPGDPDQFGNNGSNNGSAVISMILSGYREGI